MLRSVLGLAVAVFLAGCSGDITGQDRYIAAAHTAFGEIRGATPEKPGQHFADNLKDKEAAAQLAQLQRYIPAGPPRSTKLVGWRYFQLSGAPKTVNIDEEYDYGDRVALVQTSLQWPTTGEAWTVTGIHVRLATRKELETNQFNLEGKSWLQYLFLAAAIASPLLMLGALVKVLFRGGLRRKWLWAILSFLGLFSFQMDWSSGAVSAQWLTVQFIDAGATRGTSLFSVWLINATLPLGALLILSGLWANPARASKKPDKTASHRPPPTVLGGPE